LRPLDARDEAFELIAPPCVDDREDDFAEGMEVLRAGEPDEAREVLLFALEGCGDNPHVHVALGRIAAASGTPDGLMLARGHFGYVVDLVLAALPEGFRGTLPADRPVNRAAFDAAEGLASCLERMGQRRDADEVRGLARCWAGERR
jgi:hypothetical protein